MSGAAVPQGLAGYMPAPPPRPCG